MRSHYTFSTCVRSFRAGVASAWPGSAYVDAGSQRRDLGVEPHSLPGPSGVREVPLPRHLDQVDARGVALTDPGEPQVYQPTPAGRIQLAAVLAPQRHDARFPGTRDERDGRCALWRDTR